MNIQSVSKRIVGAICSLSLIFLSGCTTTQSFGGPEGAAVAEFKKDQVITVFYRNGSLASVRVRVRESTANELIVEDSDNVAATIPWVLIDHVEVKKVSALKTGLVIGAVITIVVAAQTASAFSSILSVP